MNPLAGLARVLDVPALYALWQRPFIGPKWAAIERNNRELFPRRVLDIGCGPGVNCEHFENCEYLGVDLNARYIAAARRRFGRDFQVADARELPATTRGAYDFILLNSLLHHLSDDDARRVLRQAAAALTPDGHVHVIDLVLPAERGVALCHARLDRGDFPRPLENWRALLREAFDEVVFEPFSVRWLGIECLRLVYFKGGCPALMSNQNERRSRGSQ